MSEQLRHTFFSRAGAAQAIVALLLALGSSLSLSAGAAPTRLLGVSAQGSAVLIEATEPAAYVVKRPDALTVLVELRDVSVGTASANVVVDRRDAITSVTLEQGVGDDGQTVARVRVGLSRPVEYAVHSARNTIRLDLTAPAHEVASDPPPVPGASVLKRNSADFAPAVEAPAATSIDRVRSKYTPTATTITLGGNGRLTPTDVSEVEGTPRRVVLDFANVSSNAPSPVSTEGPLVKRVRVSVNSRTPLVTRVVMEIAEAATYHVERAGTAGSDLAVVFESAQKSNTAMLTSAPAGTARSEPEPDISIEQAIANAAAITPKAAPAEPPAPVAAAKAPAQSPAQAPAPAPTQPPVQAPAPVAARQLPAEAPAPVAARQASASTRPAAPAPPQTMPAREQTPPAAPAQSPPRPTQQVITGGGEKQYKGTPITLDFSGADLRSVLRYFNEISGLNIIIDPSVPATPIDVVLRDVPWDQAFETLLKTHKLGYVAEGTIVRIAPLSVLAEEEGDRRKLAEAKALAGDLRVQTFSLSYAKAGDLSPLLVKSALSQR